MDKSESGKSLFSEIKQIGIVARDMYKVKEYYESIGIGPWESSGKPPIDNTLLRGKPLEAKHSTLFTQVGSMQLELLQPVEGESTAREFLEKRGEGIQHIAFHVESIEDALPKVAELGIKVLQRGWRPDGGGYALLETDAVGGIILELIQVPSK